MCDSEETWSEGTLELSLQCWREKWGSQDHGKMTCQYMISFLLHIYEYVCKWISNYPVGQSVSACIHLKPLSCQSSSQNTKALAGQIKLPWVGSWNCEYLALDVAGVMKYLDCF